jgi:hypothetical protein
MMEGRKNDTDKLRWDLLPVEPMNLVVDVYTRGAKKYEDNNWRKGIRWGRIFAALMRHAWAFWRGERNDPEDGQHHLASVVWCALSLMEYENTHPELDDRMLVPMESITIYKYKCRRCSFFFETSKPGPIECPNCRNLRIDWLNANIVKKDTTIENWWERELSEDT